MFKVSDQAFERATLEVLFLEGELLDSTLITKVAFNLRRQNTAELTQRKNKFSKALCVPAIMGHFVGAARLIQKPQIYYCSSKLSRMVAQQYVTHSERNTRAVTIQFVSHFYDITEQGRQRLLTLKA